MLQATKGRADYQLVCYSEVHRSGRVQCWPARLLLFVGLHRTGLKALSLTLCRSARFLVLVVGACTTPPDASIDPARASAAARVEPAVTVTAGPAASVLPVYPVIRPNPEDPFRPPEPYRDEGICPFECCVYREWIAHAPLQVYRAERDTTAVAFTLAPGERFKALTGNVHLDRVGVVAVQRPVTWREGPDSVERFEPGDTVYVLSYLGEDHYRIWYRGRVVEDLRFWTYPEEPEPEKAMGDLLREPQADWWVNIRSRHGPRGWLHMSKDGDKVGLMDACSIH